MTNAFDLAVTLGLTPRQIRVLISELRNALVPLTVEGEIHPAVARVLSLCTELQRLAEPEPERDPALSTDDRLNMAVTAAIMAAERHDHEGATLWDHVAACELAIVSHRDQFPEMDVQIAEERAAYLQYTTPPPPRLIIGAANCPLCGSRMRLAPR